MKGHHCIAVNSGTSALHLGLLASGVECVHEVIIPSFTFAPTANAVSLCGATPVFVDINPDTFTMDPEAAEAYNGKYISYHARSPLRTPSRDGLPNRNLCAQGG